MCVSSMWGQEWATFWFLFWLCFASGLPCLGLPSWPTQLFSLGLTAPGCSQRSSPVLPTHGNNLHSSSAQLCTPPHTPSSCISSPPSLCFSLLPSSCCSPLYFQAPRLHCSPTDVALAPWGVSNTIQMLFECIHSRACHLVPKLLPLIFSAKEQRGAQQLASVPGFYCFLLILIKQYWKMATSSAYGSHSENMSSGLNDAQLAEPSRSVTTPARVSNRGLCLSCCFLAYGAVQIVALPAHLTACSATSQDWRRASSHCREKLV